jgi:archaetidylinositol phosphate synthase
MPELNDIRNHKRTNDILLGPLERPALQWLAVHMPAWMTPDGCTFIGLIGALTVMAGYILTKLHPAFLWLASAGFVINWFGDSLDGTLARVRKIERPVFGFFLDHMTDAASQVIIFLGLGISPYVDFSVACLGLIAYLLLSVLIFVRTCVTGDFKISYGKLGPTEIRALAVALNTYIFFAGMPAIHLDLGAYGIRTLNPYDLVVGGVTVLLLFFFFSTVIQETIRMRKANR